MKFYNINNCPHFEGKKFETKSAVSSVGFVTLGQRIRGLICNNKLDLSGVKPSEDYDDLNEKNEDWSKERDIPYDETQDFSDKIDLADKIDTVSSRLSDSIEEQVSLEVAKSKIKEKSVSSETDALETTGGDDE